MEILQEKHPEERPLNPDTVSQADSPHSNFHPIVFEGIHASLVHSAALKVKGSAGPSGLDAYDRRCLCTVFNRYSDDLCDAVAAVTGHLCTEYVDPNAIKGLTSCRLIALNKKPGVRQIGVAESLRHIIGKAILAIISDDIQKAAGSMQLCAGQFGGIEAAIHTMNIAMEDDAIEAAVFVDASNAFNNINIQRVCPALTIIATNTYRKASSLFVDQQTIQSKEGTTQGNPLAMAIYAIAVRPLIDRVQNEAMQVWFADDVVASGKLPHLKEWWAKLSLSGPNFGYFPNALKRVVVTKPQHLEGAAMIFAESEVMITTEGTKYLGMPIRSEAFVNNFIERKVAEWVAEIEQLASIAKVSHNQPMQHSHTVLILSGCSF